LEVYRLRHRLLSLFGKSVQMTEALDVEAVVEQCVTAACEKLPKGVFEISVSPAPGQGVAIRVLPRNEGCAQISAYAENGNPLISLWIGRSTMIELTPREDNQPDLDLLTTICHEVFLGRFREELWLVDGEVRKCHGKVTLNGTEHTFRYYAGSRLASKADHAVVVYYSPYYEKD